MSQKGLASVRALRWALWGGIAVSALVTLAYWGLGARLAGIPHLPDSGPSWYYWKLPAPETWARVTAWGFYLLHQFSFWAVIYAAQRQRARVGDGLAPYNIAALAINLFFALLRLLQTHVWYDGLAQDVSIWTSQGSVILMLIMILIMENGRRGLFFGKRVPMPRRAMRLVREYHGYVFAWATVYTFWYHPTEATSGHLIGFFYMFLLFLQGSLAHTRVHVKRGWTLFLEAFVLLHGTLVAVMQGNGLWPMFAFGFGGVLIVTQIWGLGLGRLVKGVLIALYVIAALIVYSQLGWVRLNEIVRIPLIEYALAFVLAWLLGGMAWVARRGWARPAVR